MHARCNNSDSHAYKDYGGRGIKVCEEWSYSDEGFVAFLTHVWNALGPPPPGCSIDRIDNNRGYEPGNIRWATHKQQARNTRRNVYVPFEGQQILLEDAYEIFGLHRSTVRNRRKRGWPKNLWFVPSRSYGQE
jgi:hypothetical protein